MSCDFLWKEISFQECTEVSPGKLAMKRTSIIIMLQKHCHPPSCPKPQKKELDIMSIATSELVGAGDKVCSFLLFLFMPFFRIKDSYSCLGTKKTFLAI